MLRMGERQTGAAEGQKSDSHNVNVIVVVES
jgi:hypothetical protein